MNNVPQISCQTTIDPPPPRCLVTIVSPVPVAYEEGITLFRLEDLDGTTTRGSYSRGAAVSHTAHNLTLHLLLVTLREGVVTLGSVIRT